MFSITKGLNIVYLNITILLSNEDENTVYGQGTSSVIKEKQKMVKIQKLCNLSWKLPKMLVTSAISRERNG